MAGLRLADEPLPPCNDGAAGADGAGPTVAAAVNNPRPAPSPAGGGSPRRPPSPVAPDGAAAWVVTPPPQRQSSVAGDPSHDAVGSLQLQLSTAAVQLQGLATQLEKRLDGMRGACVRGDPGCLCLRLPLGGASKTELRMWLDELLAAQVSQPHPPLPPPAHSAARRAPLSRYLPASTSATARQWPTRTTPRVPRKSVRCAGATSHARSAPSAAWSTRSRPCAGSGCDGWHSQTGPPHLRSHPSQGGGRSRSCRLVRRPGVAGGAAGAA